MINSAPPRPACLRPVSADPGSSLCTLPPPAVGCAVGRPRPAGCAPQQTVMWGSWWGPWGQSSITHRGAVTHAHATHTETTLVCVHHTHTSHAQRQHTRACTPRTRVQFCHFRQTANRPLAPRPLVSSCYPDQTRDWAPLEEGLRACLCHVPRTWCPRLETPPHQEARQGSCCLPSLSALSLSVAS